MDEKDIIETEEQKSIWKKLLNHFIITMNGMAYGLFSTLIIATIIGTVGKFFNEGTVIYDFIFDLSTVLKSLMGVGIGIGIAWALKLEGLKLISAAAAGGIASYMAIISPGVNPGFKIGDPLVIYFVVVITIVVMGYIFRKKTPVDIIIIPLFVVVFSAIITSLIDGPVSSVTTWIGEFVRTATAYQPFIMGVIIAVVMGMALTAPISSAAIAIAIGLTGIAGGASVVGCSVQMIGFAVMSRKDNNIGTVLSVAVGTSMLQFKNIARKPIIWLPTIIASAILGPIATIVFKTVASPIGAGMGTSGLVGQIDTFNQMGMTANMWFSLIGLQIVAPIVLVYIIDYIFRRTGLIKPGDLKI
jgi:uncharacterized membrane protein